MTALGQSGMVRALRLRDLRLLMTALTVSETGSWAYQVALVAFVYEKTDSLAWVGAVGITRMVAMTVFTPIGGVIADRYERRRVLVVSDVACAVLQVLLVILVAADGPALLALVLSMLTSAAGSPYGPATTAMVPSLAGEDDLAGANALNALIENLVVVLGPAIGALFVLVGSNTATFAINAASFAVSGVLVALIRRPAPPVEEAPDEPAPRALAQFLDGLRAITDSPYVMAMVGFSVVASFVYGLEAVLFVGISEDKLGLGTDGFGLLLAGLGVGGVLAAPLVGRLGASPRLGLATLIGMGVYCVPMALAVVIRDPAAGFVLQVVRGAGTLVADVLAVLALQRAVPDALAARVFGVYFALAYGAIGLGSVAAPALVSGLGLDGALLVAALVPAALCLTALRVLRRMDAEAVATLAALAPRIAVLERLEVFAAAPRSALERLARGATDLAVAPGRAIVREGEAADAMYVILAGEVTVTVGDEHVRDMGAGTFFGELGLLERIPRTATVTAHTEVELLRIDGDAFLGALSAPGPARLVAETAQARLLRTHPNRQLSYTPASSST